MAGSSLSAIYQNSRVVVIAGIASIILTFYAFFSFTMKYSRMSERKILFIWFCLVYLLQPFLLLFIYKIREANAKLQELAYHDPLTGAANRLLLKEKFDLLKTSKVHSSHYYSLI